jgi:hypothetical protein
MWEGEGVVVVVMCVEWELEHTSSGVIRGGTEREQR